MIVQKQKIYVLITLLPTIDGAHFENLMILLYFMKQQLNINKEGRKFSSHCNEYLESSCDIHFCNKYLSYRIILPYTNYDITAEEKLTVNQKKYDREEIFSWIDVES